MNDKIHIEPGTMIIEVNDAGETISLPLGDQAFTGGLVELMQTFSQKADELSSAAGKIDTSANTAEKVNELSAVASLNLRICAEMRERTDALFADEVCRKVFGDIVPSLSAFSYFFDQLSPFVAKYRDDMIAACKKSVEKYTKKYHRDSDERGSEYGRS